MFFCVNVKVVLPPHPPSYSLDPLPPSSYSSAPLIHPHTVQRPSSTLIQYSPPHPTLIQFSPPHPPSYSTAPLIHPHTVQPPSPHPHTVQPPSPHPHTVQPPSSTLIQYSPPHPPSYSSAPLIQFSRPQPPSSSSAALIQFSSPHPTLIQYSHPYPPSYSTAPLTPPSYSTALLTSLMRFSSPWLNAFNSLAVLSSTVPLVSVVIASNGHEYTATLASVACEILPAKIKRNLGKNCQRSQKNFSRSPSTSLLKTIPFITVEASTPEPCREQWSRGQSTAPLAPRENVLEKSRI